MHAQGNDRSLKSAKQAAIDALAELGPELFSSIAERRRKRTTPVIMVVDDDAISRAIVSNIVKSYDWVSVQDGQHALREYVVCAPDVLILDIGLPDINGHDILQCLFQIDPQAYVVMFSKHKDEHNVLQAAKEGAQGYVGKPFTREKILKYISRSPHIREKQALLLNPEKRRRKKNLQ